MQPVGIDLDHRTGNQRLHSFQDRVGIIAERITWKRISARHRGIVHARDAMFAPVDLVQEHIVLEAAAIATDQGRVESGQRRDTLRHSRDSGIVAHAAHQIQQIVGSCVLFGIGQHIGRHRALGSE